MMLCFIIAMAVTIIIIVVVVHIFIIFSPPFLLLFLLLPLLPLAVLNHAGIMAGRAAPSTAGPLQVSG